MLKTNILKLEGTVMKLSVSQSQLSQALSIVSRSVDTKRLLPILTNVLLTTEDGNLRLSATNLELGINHRIPADITEEGSITVPAKTLIDLINTLPNDVVHLELNRDTSTLIVRCVQIVTDIKGLDAEDFPPMPVFDPDNAIVFNLPDLKKMIQQVAFAASTEETRPILQGIFLTVTGAEMTLVATDGYRIAKRSAKLETALETPISAIIPARALIEVNRIPGDSSNLIYMNLAAGKNQVVFHQEHVDIASQLISGAYIDYKAIIPKNFKTDTVASTAALQKACTQAMIIARDSKFLTHFNIRPGDGDGGTIQISAASEETGTYENQLPANINGDEINIAFNVRFLRDVLDVISSSQVMIRTNTNVSPSLITPLEDEADFEYVLMPMNPKR